MQSSGPEKPHVPPRGDLRVGCPVTRLLAMIADQPGSSDGEPPARSGIGDHAQISKLPVRVRSLGLLRNARLRSGGRLRDTWSLTGRGRALHSAFGGSLAGA